MICNCGRSSEHHPDCLVAQAMRWRCPDCRARRRDTGIRHANHCKLKEYQP